MRGAGDGLAVNNARYGCDLFEGGFHPATIQKRAVQKTTA